MFVPHVGFQHGLEALLTFPEKRTRWSWHSCPFKLTILHGWIIWSDRNFADILLASRYQTHSITMSGEDSLKQIHKGDVEKVPIFAGIKGVKLHCCGFRFSGYERFICEQLPSIPQKTQRSRWSCMPDPSLSEKITNAVGNWSPSVKRPKRSSGGAVLWCRCRFSHENLEVKGFGNGTVKRFFLNQKVPRIPTCILQE